jgi:Saccharopine dehydrogenase NADP binding domain
MPPTIVVFGATGYTGRLTAERLVAHGTAPVLAGRSEARLRELSDRLGGLEVRTADVERPESVADLLAPGDVIVACVGPFLRWGEPAVRAAVAKGAIYLDSTGEPPFIRRVFDEFGPQAREAGATLMPAMGYDFVPGALAGALALEQAGSAASRVDVGYFMLGAGPNAMSRGTKASLAGVALSEAFAFRGGRLQGVRSAERYRTFPVKGKERAGISVGGAEHFTLPPAYPQLQEVNVYLGWFGPLARGIQLTSGVTAAAARVPLVRRALMAGAGKLAGLGGSPEAGTTPDALSWIAAAAYGPGSDTPLAEVALKGADGYAFTAGFLAWAARRAAAEGVALTGAAGPIEAFGRDGVQAGCDEAGLAKTA